MTDAELIAASRIGDADAYAELYRRHLPAAQAAARAMCRNRSDADDVVSEAFANVLRVLQNGNGPELAFRPYLLVAVRNRFYDTTRRRREDPVDEPTEELDLALIDSIAGHDDAMLAAVAFATLPERWQVVLWHTEIEGRTPAEAAPLLGLAPNAVSALAYRAREGLRQAFLQAHLQTPRESACRDCVGELGAYVRDGLSDRDRRRVDEHLAQCDSCRALLAELTDTNTMLRSGLVPAILGIPAAKYLAGLGGKGLQGWFGRLSRLQQAAVAATAAGAAAAAVVTAVVLSTNGNGQADAAPVASRPRTAVSTVVETVPAESTPTTTPTSTGTSIQLAALPPVPISVSTTLPPGAVNRVPVRGNPQATPTTVPASIAGATSPTTATATTTTTATPTATPTATLPAPSTTVAIVPRLALTSVQLGLALLGGEVRVQLTVAASALPTNQFRTNAFANLVVAVPLPAGVSLVGADNPTWSCTPQGTCTIASLVGGSSSTAVLRLGIATTAALPISFAPVVTAPPNSVVQSQPLSITATTIAGLQTQEYARGSVAAIGNTVLSDCLVLVCLPVDVDKDPKTFNSSTADLKFTGTVAKAILVWSGDSTAADRDTVMFLTPSGPVDVVADQLSSGYSVDYANAFTAFKDVTGQVTVAGSYGVANLRTSEKSYGGWSLIVITHDDTQPVRSLMIALPMTYVIDGTPLGMVLSGSSTVSAGHIVVSAFEGDEKPLIGDTLKVNGLDLAGIDPFHGGIVGAPRNPELLQNYRVDLLDASAVDLGAASPTLDFATTNDAVMIAAVGVALDLL